MSLNYVIAKTGARLTGMIRQVLSEEMNLGGERVGMCAPGEQADYQVCVFLYDIRKNKDVVQTGMVAVSEDQLRYPSAYYDLYYIIVPCPDSDLKYRQEESAKLMDVLLQCLADFWTLDVGVGREIPFELCDLDFDSKTKVWAGLGQPLRAAVYCKAGPVEICSGRLKKVVRVREVGVRVAQEGEET